MSSSPSSPCQPGGQAPRRAAPVIHPPPLLGPDDPPPARVLNAEAQAPVIVLCDHASNAIPSALGTLGLDGEALERHIAYDPGAAALARALSQRWKAPAVLAGYSRLVVDPNRDLDDPTAIPVISDGTIVPGNRSLDAAEAERRVQAVFVPYHRAIADLIAIRRARGVAPALISVHSFTPVMRGVERPWHIGVLWDGDPRIPVPLLDRLERDGRWRVGDNQPYTGRGTTGGTIETHATPAGLPNVLLEVRQDLLATAAGIAEWTDALDAALGPILADPALYRVEHHPRRPEFEPS